MSEPQSTPLGGQVSTAQHAALGSSDAPFAHVRALLYRFSARQDRTLLFVSDYVEHLTGYAPSRLVGTSLYEWARRLIHEEDRARTKPAFRRAMLRGEPYSLEYRIIDASGNVRWVADQGGPVLDAVGRVVAMEGAAVEITAQKRSEAFYADQTRVLELLGAGLPITHVLEELVLAIERHHPGMLGSVLLLEDDKTLRHGAAPSLPHDYIRAIDGTPIGPSVGSCGTACWLGETVIVSDIETDPLWADFKNLALSNGLRACWSMPIVSAGGKVLGSFAMYFFETRTPDAAALSLIAQAAHLAGIAISSWADRNRLRQQAEQLSLTFSQAAIGFVVTDMRGRLTRVNSKFCEIAGFSEAALLGRNLEEIVLEEDVPVERQARERLLRDSADMVEYETRYVRGDGKLVWGNVWSSLVHDAEGRITHWVGVIEDITEWRAFQEEIRALNVELEQRVSQRTAALETSNRELESFSYSVSHDLRAPLRALDGFSLLLADEFGDKLGDAGHEYLQRIRRASQRMGELIDNLLELARISRANLRYERVDLSQLVADIADEIAFPEPDRSVEWDIAPDVVVSGDALLLRVMLENLMRNAWKFTRDVAQPRIVFSSHEGSDEIIYAITDTGIGFDMAYAGKLFVPFQRLHKPDQYSGSGVGLATVRRIVQRHGGRVWAESKPGGGASFFFTLGQDVVSNR